MDFNDVLRHELSCFIIGFKYSGDIQNLVLNTNNSIASFQLLGNDFSGDNKTYKAENDDFHVTLIENEEDKMFDDRVNSAVCSCNPGIKLIFSTV